MNEELGTSVTYDLGKPEILMRHERTEAVPDSLKVRIFAIGYRAIYRGGDVHLASHHTEYRWVGKKDVEVALLFSGGWRTGVAEYISSNEKSS
jgi:hypothetical protein